MLDNAIRKINDEMGKNGNDPYIQAIGGFLLETVNSNPETAAKIVVSEKTIEKSLVEVRKAAEKKKKNNVAVMAHKEVFDLVLKYFDITPVGKPAAVKSAPGGRSSFDVNLDDLFDTD